MYKVKRFSQITEDQRCYGLLGKFGKINRWRVSKARSLDDKIKEAYKLSRDSNLRSMRAKLEGPNLSNPRIESRLIKEAKKNKIAVVGHAPSFGSSIVKSDMVDKSTIDSFKGVYGKDAAKDLSSKLKSNKHVIFHDLGKNNEVLAHELGHGLNKESWNPITRFVSNNSSQITPNELDKGLVKSAKNRIKGLIKLKDEKSATKKGLELLKKSGASEGEMKLAENNLKSDYDTYEGNIKASYLIPIRNTLRGKKIKGRN